GADLRDRQRALRLERCCWQRHLPAVAVVNRLDAGHAAPAQPGGDLLRPELAPTGVHLVLDETSKLGGRSIDLIQVGVVLIGGLRVEQVAEVSLPISRAYKVRREVHRLWITEPGWGVDPGRQVEPVTIGVAGKIGQRLVAE